MVIDDRTQQTRSGPRVVGTAVTSELLLLRQFVGQNLDPRPTPHDIPTDAGHCAKISWNPKKNTPACNAPLTAGQFTITPRNRAATAALDASPLMRIPIMRDIAPPIDCPPKKNGSFVILLRMSPSSPKLHFSDLGKPGKGTAKDHRGEQFRNILTARSKPWRVRNHVLSYSNSMMDIAKYLTKDRASSPSPEITRLGEEGRGVPFLTLPYLTLLLLPTDC